MLKAFDIQWCQVLCIMLQLQASLPPMFSPIRCSPHSATQSKAVIPSSFPEGRQMLTFGFDLVLWELQGPCLPPLSSPAPGAGQGFCSSAASAPAHWHCASERKVWGHWSLQITPPLSQRPALHIKSWGSFRTLPEKKIQQNHLSKTMVLLAVA